MVPSNIYASEQFAALLMVEQQPTFACEYLGTLDLAHDFGCLTACRLRRFQAAAFGPSGTNRGAGQV